MTGARSAAASGVLGSGSAGTDRREGGGPFLTDTRALMASIRAGDDARLELREVRFRGRRLALGDEDGRAVIRLAEVFVSMANTDGGTVVMGVRDRDRMPVGVDPEKRELLEQFVAGAALEACEPPIVPSLDWEFLPGAGDEPKLCLIVEIPKSLRTVHSTSDGRYFHRIGSHRARIPPERLVRLMTERGVLGQIEERPVMTAALDDLDPSRLARYFRGRFADWRSPGAAMEEWAPLLTAHKLAAATGDGPRPTHLGVLLFAETPDRFVPGAFVDLVAYRHSDPDGNSADSKRLTGPVPEQILQVLTYFSSSPLNPVRSEKGALGRTDFPAYAAAALQEAAVNALVHRDYGVPGSQVIISMFPDRIEFRNPGALPNALTIENLYAGCQPVRRNQLLAGFLREYQSPWTGGSFMEARGEGFRGLVTASEKLSGRRPRLEQIGQAMKLTVWAAPGARA